MRRGQSTVEPMLGITAAVGSVLVAAACFPDEAYAVLVAGASFLEHNSGFQSWLAWMEGR